MIEGYLRQFEAFAANGGRSNPSWLKARRAAAIDAFRSTGFPTPRDEEWRFTPVAPISRGDFSKVAPAGPVSWAELEPHLFGHPEWPRLVFVNGRYDPDLSAGQPTLGAVASIHESLQSAAAELEPHFGGHLPANTTPFASLNLALAKDGGWIRIAPDSIERAPIHLVFITTAEAHDSGVHPRTVIVVGPRARAQFIESYITLGGAPRHLTNTVVEISVGEGAWVEHSRIQRESEAGFHIGLTHVSQAGHSHYRSFTLAMGGALSRHDLRTRLNAPDAEALLYGLYLGHRDQLVDNHTTIFHDQPHCRSWEVYKGILDERSHGVFNGKILVTPEAQKTDAKQTNRALLLSDAARIDTKPQLEIFADDVKCTHGATVGQLDPIWAFYLRSRGIPAEMARRMMIAAFAAEVLDEIASEPVREALRAVVAERLGQVG